MNRVFLHTSRGYTVLEVLLAVALVATLAGMALPLSASTIDHLRTAAAARHVAARVATTRLEAVKRSTSVALRFQRRDADYAVGMFVDGNGNGLRAVDVANGIDTPIGPAEHLADLFAGTAFGLLPGLPDVDGALGGTDGVRIGSSSFLSFTPSGSATSGTLYIKGRRAQYAVRVLGATGRARLFVYDSGARRWIAR